MKHFVSDIEYAFLEGYRKGYTEGYAAGVNAVLRRLSLHERMKIINIIPDFHMEVTG